jgi:hypothetical protein
VGFLADGALESSAGWIRVGGVPGHQRGDVGGVEHAGGARLQVLEVPEVIDVALRCHGDQQLGRLLGGGVAEPVRYADRALTPLFGCDAVVWTQDAAELDQQQSLDLMAWIARTLVDATIRDP